jgi:hypothetical protein
MIHCPEMRWSISADPGSRFAPVQVVQIVQSVQDVLNGAVQRGG